MGGEKFAEILNKLKEVRESRQKSGFWLYGIRGYVKSHLWLRLSVIGLREGKELYIFPISVSALKILFLILKQQCYLPGQIMTSGRG